MTTRAELLDGLRLRLADHQKRRWSDEELLAYLRAAAIDYAMHFPRRREQFFTTDGTSRRYDLPADLLDDRIVEVALIGLDGREELLYPRSLVYQGTRWYEVVGEELHFGWVPIGNLTVRVRYDAIHDLPETGPVTIPPEDEELVYVAAMAMAWQRLAGNDAALSRWKEEGRRDDNPVLPQHTELWARYRRMIETKRGAMRVGRRVRRPWRR